MAPQRRLVRDEADARQLATAWAASPLNFRAFCLERGIDGRSLRHWLRRVQPAPVAEAPLRLVEWVSAGPNQPATYRVMLGDAVVEVSDDFHDETLSRLLRVVAAC